MMLDLMMKLAYPVVLVSRIGLGAINHALLSLESLQITGLEVAGIVFNRVGRSNSEDRFIEEDNPKTISRFGRVEIIGNIEYNEPGLEPGVVWERFEESMPGLQIIKRILERG